MKNLSDVFDVVSRLGLLKHLPQVGGGVPAVLLDPLESLGTL